MTTLRRLRALLAVLLATILLAACGSSGGDDAKTDADGGSAAEETAADGTWDGEELTKDNFGERILAAQREAGSYAMQVEQDAGGQSSTTTGVGRMSGDATDAHTKTEAGGQKMETIVLDRIIYIKAPSLKTDKPWLKIDPKANSGIGKMFGDLGGNSDPQKLTEAFAKAVSIEATDGVEEIDGVDTRLHHLSLPSSVLVEQLGMPEQMASMLPKTIDYDVWLDEQDLMRRMEMEMEVMGQKSATEITFSDYGEDVTIEAPPADQVTTKEPAMPGAMG